MSSMTDLIDSPSLTLPKDENIVDKNRDGYIIISQADVFNHVFVPCQQENTSAKLMIPAVAEYMRSICRHKDMEPEGYMNELLVSLLVRVERYYEFHQYLQYHILNDSPQISEQLLSAGSKYRPAYQLALDMLYRLNAFTRLLRVLLERKQVTAALRLVSPRSSLFEAEGLLPRNFLQVALSTEDPNMFYLTFKFFEARNETQRNTKDFNPEDKCEIYVEHFNTLFGSEVEEMSDGYFSSDSDISDSYYESNNKDNGKTNDDTLTEMRSD